MKKMLFLCSLIAVVIFSQQGEMIGEATASETAESVEEVVAVSASPEAASKASIGFSSKNIKGETVTPTAPGDTEGTTKPVGRLPSTGETVGIGLSILGIVLIVIIFRKELKGMIENRKRIKGENIK